VASDMCTVHCTIRCRSIAVRYHATMARLLKWNKGNCICKVNRPSPTPHQTQTHSSRLDSSIHPRKRPLEKSPSGSLATNHNAFTDLPPDPKLSHRSSHVCNLCILVPLSAQPPHKLADHIRSRRTHERNAVGNRARKTRKGQN
jgi:hypothetical protein